MLFPISLAVLLVVVVVVSIPCVTANVRYGTGRHHTATRRIAPMPAVRGKHHRRVRTTE